MRVIGGTYKGRRFNPPKKFPSRPTTDFAKESLFNILVHQYDFEDLNILDLYAGTGNISIEFISRGAANVLSVDKHPVSHKFIVQTISELDVDNWQTVRRDALAFCDNCEEQFDLIFADPPFKNKNTQELVDKIMASNMLKENGVFILEHGQEFQYSGTHLKDSRKYGGVYFSFFAAN